MPLKFDITLTAEDMYRFNMYQTYSGFHGWFSIAFSILIFVVAGVTRGKIEAAYTALYIVFGIVFLVYPPVSLYLRSKRTLAMSEVLRGTLHYEVDEEGLHVSQKEESALLPWEQILCHSESTAGGKLRGTADTGCGTSAGVPFEDEVENGDFKI